MQNGALCDIENHTCQDPHFEQQQQQQQHPLITVTSPDDSIGNQLETSTKHENHDREISPSMGASYTNHDTQTNSYGRESFHLFNTKSGEVPRVEILSLNDEQEQGQDGANKQHTGHMFHRNGSPVYDDIAIVSDSESDYDSDSNQLRSDQCHDTNGGNYTHGPSWEQSTNQHAAHLQPTAEEDLVMEKFHIVPPENFQPVNDVPNGFHVEYLQESSVRSGESLDITTQIPLIKADIPINVQENISSDLPIEEKLSKLEKVEPLFLYEVPNFLQIPSLESLSLIDIGVCCAGCGINLANFANAITHQLIAGTNLAINSSAATTKVARSKSVSGSVKQGLDCEDCPAMYCSMVCKKTYKHLHKNLKHPSLKFRARVLSSVENTAQNRLKAKKHDQYDKKKDIEKQVEKENEEDEGPPPPTNYRIWNSKMEEFIKSHFWNSGYNLAMYLINIENMDTSKYGDVHKLGSLQLIKDQFLTVSLTHEDQKHNVDKSYVSIDDALLDGEEEKALKEEESTERNQLKMLREGYEIFCEMFPKYQTKKYKLAFSEFKQLIDSIEYNSQICDRVPEAYGLNIPILSMFQHSCYPNCVVLKQMDNLPNSAGASKSSPKQAGKTVRYAIKPVRSIRSNEILTFSYVSEKHSEEERNFELKYKFGIEKCHCDKCFEDRNKRFQSSYELSLSSLDLSRAGSTQSSRENTVEEDSHKHEAHRRKSSMKTGSKGKCVEGRRPSVRFDGKVVALNI